MIVWPHSVNMLGFAETLTCKEKLRGENILYFEN